MGTYYPGDGSIVYYGEDKTACVEQLRNEARELDRASHDYQSIGYSGHSAGKAFDARQKRREADRTERYGK